MLLKQDFKIFMEYYIGVNLMLVVIFEKVVDFYEGMEWL